MAGYDVGSERPGAEAWVPLRQSKGRPRQAGAGRISVTVLAAGVPEGRLDEVVEQPGCGSDALGPRRRGRVAVSVLNHIGPCRIRVVTYIATKRVSVGFRRLHLDLRVAALLMCR